MDRRYDLVRVSGDRVEQAEYTRFEDDSVFIVAEGYNHFEIRETLASPYGLLGRVVLEQMKLTAD